MSSTKWIEDGSAYRLGDPREPMAVTYMTQGIWAWRTNFGRSGYERTLEEAKCTAEKSLREIADSILAALRDVKEDK